MTSGPQPVPSTPPAGPRLLRAFARDRRGAALLAFGLAAPLLFGAVAATVTYGQLTARRAQMQVAADVAVLTAARELSLINATDQQLISTAQTVASDRLAAGRPLGTRANPSASLLRNAKGERSGVAITVTETVETPFGKLLSYPDFNLQVRAEAKLSGSAKVCLVGLATAVRGSVSLKKSAQITAQGCALYSNSRDREGLVAEDDATVTAALVCSAGGFREGKKGASIRPEPVTDCPALADPLAARPAPSYPGYCVGIDEVRGPAAKEDKKADGRKGEATKGAGAAMVDPGTGIDLSPGLYCDGLKIHGGARVRLQPGVYAFRGPLIVDGAALTGSNVGLYFEGDKASLLFDHDSTIDLTAPKTGDMAGLLMFEERRVAYPDPAPGGKTKGKAPPAPPGAGPLREYRIISDDAQNLLGTIYLPNGRLILDSKKPIAERSAYTVVVARLIELFDGPNLVLNTNYGTTDIPVPKGVGPVGGAPGLSQ